MVHNQGIYADVLNGYYQPIANDDDKFIETDRTTIQLSSLQMDSITDDTTIGQIEDMVLQDARCIFAKKWNIELADLDIKEKKI